MARMAYHSTVIEGNSLTQGETKSVLIEQFIPRPMDLRELNEVLNYRKLLPYLDEYQNEEIFIEGIKEVNRIIIENIEEWRGQGGNHHEPALAFWAHEALFYVIKKGPRIIGILFIIKKLNKENATLKSYLLYSYIPFIIYGKKFTAFCMMLVLLGEILKKPKHVTLEIVFEKTSLFKIVERHCSCNGGDDNPWSN